MTKYIEGERAKYWPVPKKLMAQYSDGSYDRKAFNGDLYWTQNGTYHRDGDKPAIIEADGSLTWRQNGEQHRDGDRPAYIDCDGTVIWYLNDQPHRFVGPSFIGSDGSLEWYINGEEITEEVNRWLDGQPWCGTPEQIFEFQLRFT